MLTVAYWLIIVSLTWNTLLLNVGLFTFLTSFVIIITVVNVLPDKNVNAFLGYLHSSINNEKNNYPHVVHKISVDLNQADLKAVLPKFEQQIKFTPRSGDILDKAYSNITC